jgi:hypothetical protein
VGGSVFRRESIVNVGPGGGRMGTHCGTFELFPKSVTKSEYINGHTYFLKASQRTSTDTLLN